MLRVAGEDQAVDSVRFLTAARPDCPALTLRFGDQADARPIRHAADPPATGGALSVQAVANHGIQP